jgi:hypothetical protein
MVDDDDIAKIWKRLSEIEKGLKETNRLHKILDEYCTDTFKEAFDQIGKTRESMTKVVSAVSTAKRKP